ncbi:MAG: hypothetical protein L6Q59_02030 [Ignavibacteriaceae bacterium]|nr:hypothetical protein [Ignavibacteriaceae bacterium]
MLKKPDGAVMTCRTASQLAGDCHAENTLTTRTKLNRKKNATMIVTPPDFFGMSVHLS